MICTATLPPEEIMIETHLLNLALISSNRSNAVSVYFQTKPCELKSDAIRLKELIRELAEAAESNRDLEAWKKMATAMENWLKPEAALHALFVCPQQAIWKEFELPAHSGPDSVDIDNVFHVVPLLRSLQHPATAMVVLVERERARICAVKNGLTADHVVEVHDRPFQLCAHDNRTGWSSHIERHKDDHAHRFFDQVLEEVGKVPGEYPIIVGCRYDVWSELHPRISAGLENRMIGRFVPTSLEMGDEEILEQTNYVLREHDSEQRKMLAYRIRDNEGTLAITGLEQVTAALARGAAKELILATPARLHLHRCTDCGRLNVAATACSDCGAPRLQTVDSEEALTREALSQGAKVTFLENHAFEECEGVAAFLRFALPKMRGQNRNHWAVQSIGR